MNKQIFEGLTSGTKPKGFILKKFAFAEPQDTWTTSTFYDLVGWVQQRRGWRGQKRRVRVDQTR